MVSGYTASWLTGALLVWSTARVHTPQLYQLQKIGLGAFGHLSFDGPKDRALRLAKHHFQCAKVDPELSGFQDINFSDFFHIFGELVWGSSRTMRPNRNLEPWRDAYKAVVAKFKYDKAQRWTALNVDNNTQAAFASAMFDEVLRASR